MNAESQGIDWAMKLMYDNKGQEIERAMSGDLQSLTEYDGFGHIQRHTVKSRNRTTRKMSYRWSPNDKLIGIVNELTQRNTWFDYDTLGNLTGSTHNKIEELFRTPDAVGNIYRTPDRSDRKYSASGRLEESDQFKFTYDTEGNLLEKAKLNGERWQYQWNANGSLKQVTRPDKKVVSFEYDALGRRTAKIFKETITRWVWDGNTPLHEWSYSLADRPQEIKDFMGFRSKDREEPVNNPITWVFEEGTFRPAAKLTEKGAYSIITDYLGTPVEMYNKYGEKTWETRLDIYGKVASFESGKYESSSLSDCPFRYQGQYEDSETGLYYNRFRYYSPDEGMYISQDPIGLEGGNPTLYGYVENPNGLVDVFGLWTIKIDGYTIRVHANDLDHWPSIPHGHIYDNNLVVDSVGNIFIAHKGKQVGSLSKKGKKQWLEALKANCR